MQAATWFNETTKQDRDSIKKLHFSSNNIGTMQPLNHRDASNSRPVHDRPLDTKISVDISSRPLWKNSATPIMTPANPFSGRMGDNLHGNARKLGNFGNQARAASVLAHSSRYPQTKKRRLENLSTEGADQRVFKSKYYESPLEPPNSSKQSPAEVIVLDNSDEEKEKSLPWPKSSSPDPIDGLSKPADTLQSARPPISSSRAGPSRQLPEDGLATTRTKGKFAKKPQMPPPDDLQEIDHVDLDDDPIESIDSDPPAVRKVSALIQPGTVVKTIAMFEQRSQLNSQGRTPRELDLSKTTVKSKMKTRSSSATLQTTPVVAPVSQKDTEATAPSGYHQGLFSLPLDRVVIGNNDVTSDKAEPYWLHLTAKGELKITKGQMKPWGDLHDAELLIHELEYAHASQRPVMIRIRTHKIRKTVNLSGFTPGSRGTDGQVLFLFNTEGSNWQNGKHYDRLMEWFKKKVETFHLRDPALKALLDMFNNSYEMSHATPAIRASASRDSISSSRTVQQDGEARSVSSVQANTRRPSLDEVRLVAPRELRRSGRRSAPEPIPEPVQNPDEVLFIYPFTGTGGVEITRGDMKRLEPGQYLNDTLIEFGLKIWLAEFRQSSPELANQIHIFSSFFYKKINVRNKEQGYQSVRKWTAKIDIFSKKYLIVPINENLHWYLAIICNPDYVLRPPPLPTAPSIGKERPMTRKRKREVHAFEVEAGLADSEAPDADAPTAQVSASQTASRATSLLSSVPLSRQHSPENEVIADSEAEAEVRNSGVVQTQGEEGKHKEEKEVEQLLVLERSCSISDPRDKPRGSSPDSAMELTYPSDDPSGHEPMDVDNEHAENASFNPESLIPVDGGAKPISAAQFYGSTSSSKGKEKATEQPPAEDPPQEEEEQVSVPPDPSHEQTYIFTFDSLGSKHPKACTTLASYLTLEAKDKKGIEETTQPYTKFALVPYQPNYCDCGIYVLHFAKKFIEDPSKFIRLILTSNAKEYDAQARGRDWDHDSVANLRDDLTARCVSLTDDWKEWKEAEKKKAAEASNTTTNQTTVDDSDDDIVVTNVSGGPSKGKGRTPRSKGKTIFIKSVSAAARLR